jgi:hypothetical protein
MKKSLPHLVVLTVMFISTIGVVLLTKGPYANAFLNEAEAIVIIFCAFLAIDVLRWIIRMMAEGAVTQSKRQEISWTIGAVVCMVYFLWRTWHLYSLWQVFLVAMVCAVLMLGLLVRLFSRWDADCVRWITWAGCCFLLTMAIGMSVLLWKPMIVTEAEELVVSSTGDNSYVFHYIKSLKSPEYPLGFYFCNRKQTDGSWSSDGRGRAVVYLGENQEDWRSLAPQE